MILSIQVAEVSSLFCVGYLVALVREYVDLPLRDRDPNPIPRPRFTHVPRAGLKKIWGPVLRLFMRPLTMMMMILIRWWRWW